MHKRARGRGTQQLRALVGSVVLDVEPGLDVRRAQHHGHAIVDLVHVLARGRRDDRAGLQWRGVFDVGVAPLFVESREEHELTVTAREVVAVSYTHLDVYKRQALVSLGLGYMGSSKVPDTYAHAVLEPAVQFSSRDDDYDDYGEVASEPQWRHDAVPRRAFG